jgi:hypothetical protein
MRWMSGGNIGGLADCQDWHKANGSFDPAGLN